MEIKLCHFCGAENIESENGSFLCLKCGYHTSEIFKQEDRDRIETGMPKLLKSLRYNDKRTGLIWYPIVINIPKVGILFPDGSNADDWKWNFSKIISIPLLERMQYPIPGKEGEFYETRLDIENGKKYPRNKFEEAYKDFIEYVKTR